MENASKALIIAGAILLSILIIALGIFIYNQAKAAINTDTLTSTEISTYNAQFSQYEGDTILGSSVKSLLDALISNASTNSDSAEKLPSVYYTGGSDSSNVTGHFPDGQTSTYIANIQTIRQSISNTHNYQVIMDYTGDSTGGSDYGATGYVQGIVINYSKK